MSKPQPLPTLEMPMEHFTAMLHYVTRRTYVATALAHYTRANAGNASAIETIQAMENVELLAMDQLRTFLTSECDITTLPRVIDIMDRPEIDECVVTTMLATGSITITNLDKWSLTMNTLNSISNMNGKGTFL